MLSVLRRWVGGVGGAGSTAGGGAKRWTFGELAEDWLRRVGKRRVCPENERRHVRHLSPLGRLREGTLTKAAIEELFGQLGQGTAEGGRKLSASTLNKLRSTGRLVIRDAQGNGLWHGPNPFDLVRRARPTKSVHTTLTRREVQRVLRHLREDRRRLVKAMVLLGTRPGEALGMRREDVDLAAGVVVVRRSHGRAQTKTGRERVVPIHSELVADFRRVLRGPSPYVFGRRDGGRRRGSAKRLTDILCEALAAAGIEKRMRFYDLRHTSATLYRKAGCDPLVVRLLLGHVSRSTTDDYTHLDLTYQRRELQRLFLGRA